MKFDTVAALEFGTQEDSLCFRQGRAAVALRLLPMVGAPVVDGLFVIWGLPHMFFPVFPMLMVAVPFQIGYTAWVLRDRLLPYVVDVQTGVLRRGKSQVCALADLEGVGVVIYRGRSNIYYIAVALRGQPARRKLLALLTYRSAQAGAQELAQRLNTPLVTDTNGGIWRK